ncbi:hypothetical protein GCM10007036_18720 [Alsobacter metallidurans]|uniref:GtrA/DPMS transmembrane domain-containing protein n=1 Tax=Alsobacter metallidurans TaxID=340221 RepID=A0A917I727_9HYPH|nr:GtrA family protein [Alsobacter metallidurans]GGH17356.1 hypothetical protein GCM10007036_18720 [Alsobacter metallidurans]
MPDLQEKLINFNEFLRFVVTGVTATVGNLAAVFLSRDHAPFGVSLLCGLAAGFSISFLLTKIFAFRSHAWDRAPGELGRFLLVYALGSAVYWVVAFVLGRYALTPYLPLHMAELAGAFVGAGLMTFTSYFGHRFFTYRTFRPTEAPRISSASDV